VPDPADAYRPTAADGDALGGLVETLGFGPLTRRACLEWAARGANG
jgi:hypothetical protein